MKSTAQKTLDSTVTSPLKLSTQNLPCTPEFKTRFEREARILSSLSHPNICALYDVGKEGNLEFLVMEFARRGDPFESAAERASTMKRGEHVMTMGGQVNYHTPHWHGNVVTVDKHHTDIFSILPAQFVTADMVPDKIGTWMFHCHIDEHMEMRMMAMYQVQP